MDDPAGAIRERLEELRGVPWPGPIEYHEVVGSTSDLLKSRADRAPEWSVVVAGSQTGGRGRHGHSWISPAGGLYLSMLLRPRLGPDRLGLLPLAVGLAVAEALGPAGLDARIKWPNDIVIGGRKLAGVLAEGSAGPARGAGLDWVVLGIGVNVNADLPVDGAPEATTLRTETGRPADVTALAADVLASVGLWYHALSHGETARILAVWRERSVAWWGRRIEVLCAGRVLEGVARDIDASGALLVETGPGDWVRVVSGEARELRLAGSGADE